MQQSPADSAFNQRPPVLLKDRMNRWLLIAAILLSPLAAAAKSPALEEVLEPVDRAMISAHHLSRTDDQEFVRLGVERQREMRAHVHVRPDLPGAAHHDDAPAAVLDLQATAVRHGVEAAQRAIAHDQRG